MHTYMDECFPAADSVMKLISWIPPRASHTNGCTGRSITAVCKDANLQALSLYLNSVHFKLKDLKRKWLALEAPAR